MDTENEPPVQQVISYTEMCDRVGRARFGAIWDVLLTDDESSELEAGVWQASSAETYRSAEEKAKAIEWRRKWVDDWLAENGLIDPVRRQHGLEIPPVLSKRFEAAFFPVFGGSSEGELDLREELERAQKDKSARDLQTRVAPWLPPSGLTLELVKSALGDEPRPFLTSVVDLLAFGSPLPDKILQLLGLLFEQKDRDTRIETCKVLASEGYPIEKIVSERRRAAAALFDGVKRADRPVLIGSYDRNNDQLIPPHYFDVRRNLGYEDNSIATDLATLVDDPNWQKQFDVERETKPMPWLNVRVDSKWFLNWLAPQLAERAPPESEYVEPYMIEPIDSESTAGLVPLSVAIFWIMTKSGTQRVRLNDKEAWATAVAALVPFLADGTIEMTGFSLTAGNTVPRAIFALIDILAPTDMHAGDFLLSSNSFIECSIYFGSEDWKSRSYNDRLFERGNPTATWTHLQLRKTDVLSRWPRTESKSRELSSTVNHKAKSISKAPPPAPQIDTNNWSVEKGYPAIQAESAAAQAAVAVPASLPIAAFVQKKVGRPSVEVFDPIVRAMLADLATGTTTEDILAEDTQDFLRKTYKGGREVCNKARATVWVVLAMKADLANGALTIESLKEMTYRGLDERYTRSLNQAKFGKDWNIFGKARKIALEDCQLAPRS
jgi:hypothetical protein